LRRTVDAVAANGLALGKLQYISQFYIHKLISPPFSDVIPRIGLRLLDHCLRRLNVSLFWVASFFTKADRRNVSAVPFTLLRRADSLSIT
jgi:hypothetical protein